MTGLRSQALCAVYHLQVVISSGKNMSPDASGLCRYGPQPNTALVVIIAQDPAWFAASLPIMLACGVMFRRPDSAGNAGDDGNRGVHNNLTEYYAIQNAH